MAPSLSKFISQFSPAVAHGGRRHCGLKRAAGEMAAPAAAAGPAMASLGASLGIASGGSGLGLRRGRQGLHSEVSFCCGRVVCRSLLGRRNLVALRGLRGGSLSSSSSSALVGARVRRLMLASRHLTYAVSVSTESGVVVKAFDNGDGEALPLSSKPVMTLESPDLKVPGSDSVGLKPQPLMPAPKPVSRSNGSGVGRPQAIGGSESDDDSVALKPPPILAAQPSGIGNSQKQQSRDSEDDSDSVTLKGPPRPVLRLNRSGPARPQHTQGSERPSLGQILENVEKLGPSDAGPVPRGGGRGPVKARPLTTQPGAWRAGDKIRSKEERERDAAAAAEAAAAAAAAAAAERRAETADNGDAQASTSSTDSESSRTQRPRMQLNTLAKPMARPAPAPAVPRKGPVLKGVGSSGPVLRDVGAGPILKDVGAAPRSQFSRSSSPAPKNADINIGPAGPPKPFSKPAIKVNIVI